MADNYDNSTRQSVLVLHSEIISFFLSYFGNNWFTYMKSVYFYYYKYILVHEKCLNQKKF